MKMCSLNGLPGSPPSLCLHVREDLHLVDSCKGFHTEDGNGFGIVQDPSDS